MVRHARSTAQHQTETTMTNREARAALNQQKSLEAFLAKKAEFDALLAELQQMSADHFGADPEAVLWGEAANLEHWNSRLRQVTDAYFKRGEFAS
jgi:hemerythrin